MKNSSISSISKFCSRSQPKSTKCWKSSLRKEPKSTKCWHSDLFKFLFHLAFVFLDQLFVGVILIFCLLCRFFWCLILFCCLILDSLCFLSLCFLSFDFVNCFYRFPTEAFTFLFARRLLFVTCSSCICSSNFVGKLIITNFNSIG